MGLCSVFEQVHSVYKFASNSSISYITAMQFEQKENPTKRGVFPRRHREDKKSAGNNWGDEVVISHGEIQVFGL